MSSMQSTTRAARGRLAATVPRGALVISLSAAVIAALVSLLLPPRYDSEAVILLDSGGDGTNLINLSQVADLLPPGGLPMQSRRENGYAYLEMIKSRSLLTHLLAQPLPGSSGESYLTQFSSQGGNEAVRIEQAIRRIRKAISARFDSKAGIVRISAQHRRRDVASSVANQIVAELSRFNAEIRTTRARGAVAFVEQRVEESKRGLMAAEDQLAAFREANARIGNAPGLLLKQKRLERDVQLNEEVFSLLSKQLELARIQEKKEAPVFSVLDSAVPADRAKRFSPILASVLAFVLTFMCLMALSLAVTPRDLWRQSKSTR